MSALSALTLCSLAPLQARAQGPIPDQNPASPAEAPASREAPERIVVTGAAWLGYGAESAGTATKTDTPRREIPQSIQVVPRQLIQDQSAFNVDQSIRNVSGVTQSSSSSYGFFNNYLSRGLNVTFLRDGVPDGSTNNGYSRTLADVEQVEFLKGPGSALYGSGAPGGSVNLITRKPLPAPAYFTEATFGSFDTYRGVFDATGPLLGNGVLDYRFIGDYANVGGFRDLGNETVEILPTLLWRPGGGNTLVFDFDYRRVRAVPDTVGIPFRGSDLLDLPRETKLFTPFADTENSVYRGLIGHEWAFRDFLLLRQNLVFTHRDLTLLRNAFTPVFNGNSLIGRSLRDQTDDYDEFLYQLEPVWKFTTGPVAHTLLTGVELHRFWIDTARATAALPAIADISRPVVPERSRGALAFVPNFDRAIRSDQFGLYVQDQLKLNEQLQVRVGGRFDRFDVEDDGFKVTGGPRTRETSDNDRWSFQAGAVYSPLPPTSFYGGIARGHQAILTTESNRTAFGPESSTQLEIGNRTSLFDGRLQANVALYEVTRADFLQTINGEPVPVGKQRTRGVELDLTAAPLPGWSIIATYSYQKAHYAALTPGSPFLGNEVTGVPRHLASLFTTYEIQDGPLRGLGFGGGVAVKDDVFLDLANAQVVPGYAVGDLVAFYRQPRYEVQFNVANVTGERWFKNGVNAGALPGEPRSFFGTVRLKF